MVDTFVDVSHISVVGVEILFRYFQHIKESIPDHNLFPNETAENVPSYIMIKQISSKV